MIGFKIPRDQKQMLVRNIQAYIDTGWSASIGELAAANLLDFMMKQVGPIIYNGAIQDVRTVVLQQMERVDEEVYALEKPVQLLRRD